MAEENLQAKEGESVKQSDRSILEKQEGESKKAFRCYQDYRDMGPGRSYEKLVRIYEQIVLEGAPKKSVPSLNNGSLHRWASRFKWKARIQIEDKEIAEVYDDARKNAKRNRIQKIADKEAAEREEKEMRKLAEAQAKDDKKREQIQQREYAEQRRSELETKTADQAVSDVTGQLDTLESIRDRLKIMGDYGSAIAANIAVITNKVTAQIAQKKEITNDDLAKVAMCSGAYRAMFNQGAPVSIDALAKAHTLDHVFNPEIEDG